MSHSHVESLVQASAARLRAEYSARGSASIGLGRPDTVFPYTSTALNAITLHPHLIAMAAQLLGEECEELRLTQSVLWGKQILSIVAKNCDDALKYDRALSSLA